MRPRSSCCRASLSPSSFPEQAPVVVDQGEQYIAELLPVGTFVYRIRFTDSDIGQAHYCIKVGGDPAFNVTSDCNVLTASGIDGVLETTSRSISVAVVDNGAPILTSATFVQHITVLLINEPPVSVSPLVLFVNETLAVGTVVAKVLVTDREVSDVPQGEPEPEPAVLQTRVYLHRLLLSALLSPTTTPCTPRPPPCPHPCSNSRQGDLSNFTLDTTFGNRCRFPDVPVFNISSVTGEIRVADKRALNYQFCRLIFMNVIVTNVQVRWGP